MINKSIVVGITHGDINSISYELIMKTFKDQRMMEFCCPVVYGSSKVVSFYKKIFTKSIDPNFKFNIIKQAKALWRTLIWLTLPRMKLKSI